MKHSLNKFLGLDLQEAKDLATKSGFKPLSLLEGKVDIAAIADVVRPKNTIYLYYNKDNKIIAAFSEDPSRVKSWH